MVVLGTRLGFSTRFAALLLFALAEPAAAQDGNVSGTVTDAAGGAGIPGVNISLYDANGAYVAGGGTNGSGAYSVSVPAGIYFAVTTNSAGYIDKLHDNTNCVGCTVTSGTSIAVSAGATSVINFSLSAGARISGTVTNANGGAVLANVEVDVFATTGSWVTYGYSDAAGLFTSRAGLTSGTYYLKTYNSDGFIDELYNNVVCAGCSLTMSGGTAVPVTSPFTTAGVNFALTPGGRIAGSITNAATGAALQGAYVEVYKAIGTGSMYATYGYADSTGNYRTNGGLQSGSYFVRTFNPSGLVDEVYDNIACLNCNPTTGTPIAVTVGQDTNNINFALSPANGGEISGTIRNGATTQVVPGVTIDFYDSNGNYVGETSSDSQGVYRSDILPVGTYYALTTYNSAGLINELFDNRTCFISCSVLSGTPIVITAGATTAADFALSPGGELHGQITSELSGAAIAGVQVSIYSDIGVYLTSGYTNTQGNYGVTGLPTGSYLLRTRNASGFIDEVHANKVCISCDVAALGTLVPVTSPNQVVNFALAPGGSIAGRVQDTGNNPLSGITVQVYAGNGVLLHSSATNSAGVYAVSGLATNQYYLKTSNNAGYVDEVYDDVTCLSCSITSGTFVDVIAGAQTSNVDFALALGGSVSGTVTSAAAGAPISGIVVNVYSSLGAYAGGSSTNALGVYTIPGLPADTYFARTSNALGFIDEVYDDLVCLSCSTGNGTPIPLVVGQTTNNINFALGAGGRISGKVTDATGAPLAGGSVSIYATNGTYITSGTTNLAGQYTTDDGLPTGNYFARASVIGYVGKLFSDIVCVNCSPTTGTPISVTAGSTKTGIDLALPLGGRVTGRITNSSGAGIEGVTVSIYDSLTGTFMGAGTSNSSGGYSAGGLPSGSFVARTSNSGGFLDELWDDVHCVTCSVSAGKTFVVAIGSTTQDVNFELARGGRITGRVTAAGTGTPGTPIRYVTVSVYDAENRLVTSTSTNLQGEYATGGLVAGEYFVRTTFNPVGYINQLYDNLPCVSCTPAAGTSVTLAGTESRDNINFVLILGGIISGRVANSSNAPLAGVSVSIFDGNSTLAGSTLTQSDGLYTVRGLLTGVYYAKTSNTQGYINQLYGNVTCLSCGLIGATPISVTAGSTAADKNFTLTAGGSIAGTITGPGNAPLGYVFVQIYTGNGQFVQSVRTDALGRYSATIGLPQGTYFLRTSNTQGFIDEVYNDTTCVSCDPTTGTPVTVTGAAATTGINFSLAAGGWISGTVDETFGTALEGVSVSVYSAAGTFVTSEVTNANGVYKTAGAIPAGSYFVRTANSSGFIDQAYNSRECLACNPSTGTTVAVVAGQPTSGINFTLRRGGRVTGTVTAAANGRGVPGVSVSIYAAGGAFVASGTSDATGRYFTYTGLPTGSYYARTSNSSGFVDEIYDNVTCVSCAATLGKPVEVTAGSDASSVDFSLANGGRIAGTIVDTATNQPISGARVDVFSATGVFVTSTVTGSSGHYLTGSGLGKGTYFLQASSPLGYVTEVFDNRECAACSPITGTPVSVLTGQTTASVNFSLGLGGRITGLVTAAGSSQALRDISVAIYNVNNNFVASARTDATGQFTSGFGLPTGTYFARTNNSVGYIDKIHADTICLVCTPNDGTGILVTAGQVTPNINFQLSRGARMAGRVTETGTGLPLAGLSISVYDDSAVLVTIGSTDSDGRFETIGGLPDGTYFARTTNEQGYVDKVFDNALCLACDVTRGSPIAVTGPALVPGVDFSLSPGGRIAGTINSTATGAAIGNVRVTIYNPAGALVGASSSNSAGQYITTGLPPGDYRLRTFNRLGFVDEAFDDQPCGPCLMTTVGISVKVTEAATLRGTNFGLDSGGWVSGWVTDAATRAPLAGVTVSFYENGAFVARSAPSDASGYYGISLPVGTYSAQPDPFKGYSLHLTTGLQPAAIGNVSVEVGLETPNVEFPLAACTPPSVSPAILPSATAGQSFSAGLSAQGGTGSFTFSVASGALPPGLSLNVGGQIGGTPTTLGTANFTVGVTDANGCSTTQTYALFTCGVSLGESAATFAAGSGARQVTVAANSSDCAWSSSSSDSWVTITSGSGTGAGILAYAVAANPTTAQRSATITVGSQTYTVTQNGQPEQTKPDPPIGTFDTPTTGATVTGSIAVTGWTLSKAGIDRVEIWRDLTTGETTTPFNSPGHPGHGKVFIARATFVRGARPDVAGIYSTYPNADRAGWGYLLLTQGLWNVGNGTFALYAFAFDVDGQSAQLGTKTITANNAQAVKPFGALDTPGYGATVSDGFWNYGWALTPNANTADPRSCVITDGNVYVGIDSQPIVAVHYGDTRTDIGTFFPGFSNGSSAGGAYYIDTTAYGNGDHQIGWYVVDSCGRADGIGSRFFTVLNGVNITTEAAPRALAADAMAALVVGDTGPIQVRTNDVTLQSLPDEQGVHLIRLTQRQRIEMELPKVEGVSYRGGVIVSGAEQTLPLGSSLDAVRGVFYWEPAPAFLGSYELVFAAGDRAQVRVRVVIEP